MSLARLYCQQLCQHYGPGNSVRVMMLASIGIIHNELAIARVLQCQQQYQQWHLHCGTTNGINVLTSALHQHYSVATMVVLCYGHYAIKNSINIKAPATVLINLCQSKDLFSVIIMNGNPKVYNIIPDTTTPSPYRFIGTADYYWLC